MRELEPVLVCEGVGEPVRELEPVLVAVAVFVALDVHVCELLKVRDDVDVPVCTLFGLDGVGRADTRVGAGVTEEKGERDLERERRGVVDMDKVTASAPARSCWCGSSCSGMATLGEAVPEMEGSRCR